MQTILELVIVLPLPPRESSPNWRGHWATRSRAVKKYRYAAAVGATAELIRLPRSALAGFPATTATVQAEFVFPCRRQRDKDNMLASLKPAFDGLADAGVVINDSGLTHLPVQVRVRERGEEPHVRLTVRA